MPAKGWKTVNIREETYQNIEKLIRAYPELGYGDANEFIRDAIRQLIRNALDQLTLPASVRDDLFGRSDDAP
jgi:Arc/MetJ-type ribon-helix-helix transcriptional regulator